MESTRQHNEQVVRLRDQQGDPNVDDPSQCLQEDIIDAILKERERQIELAHGGDTDEFDAGNSHNDWIAYIVAYAGRAAEKVFRNEREGQTFRENIIKVAALCLAALEAECQKESDEAVMNRY